MLVNSKYTKAAWQVCVSSTTQVTKQVNMAVHTKAAEEDTFSDAACSQVSDSNGQDENNQQLKQQLHHGLMPVCGPTLLSWPRSAPPPHTHLNNVLVTCQVSSPNMQTISPPPPVSAPTEGSHVVVVKGPRPGVWWLQSCLKEKPVAHCRLEISFSTGYSIKRVHK